MISTAVSALGAVLSAVIEPLSPISNVEVSPSREVPHGLGRPESGCQSRQHGEQVPATVVGEVDDRAASWLVEYDVGRLDVLVDRCTRHVDRVQSGDAETADAVVIDLTERDSPASGCELGSLIRCTSPADRVSPLPDQERPRPVSV